MNHTKVLRRFWWVLVAGLVVAVAVGLFVYRARSEPPVYTATARLLITSPEGPYLRTSIERETQVPAGNNGTADVTTRVAPDTNVLVNAATLYPLLIESDEVAKLRTQLYGDLPGTLTAQGIYAIQSPSRFVASDVPVIELTATAGKGPQAIELATATAKTFDTWLERQQGAANISANERIGVETLATPTEAVKSTDSDLSLVALVMIATLAAFVLLAYLLDRLFPTRGQRRRLAAHDVAEAGIVAVPATGNGASHEPAEPGEVTSEPERRYRHRLNRRLRTESEASAPRSPSDERDVAKPRESAQSSRIS